MWLKGTGVDGVLEWLQDRGETRGEILCRPHLPRRLRDRFLVDGADVKERLGRLVSEYASDGA